MMLPGIGDYREPKWEVWDDEGRYVIEPEDEEDDEEEGE